MLVINSHSAVKMEQVEGRWYSDQAYQSGRQWVQVSAIQVGAVTSLVAAKITGDENVPKECITWKTLTCPAELQGRVNPIDPLGFYFFQRSSVSFQGMKLLLRSKFRPLISLRFLFTSHFSITRNFDGFQRQS